MVLRLRKSLHGLKQFSHIWYGTFKDFVISIGFMASHVDGGLYVFHDMYQGTVVATVILYVDDLIVFAQEDLNRHIKEHMTKRFRMHDFGNVSFYPGLTIKCNQEHHTIDFDQHSYICTILAKCRMDESRPVATPMAIELHKKKPDEEACNQTVDQSMIGSLMYTMGATPPNIAYAIRVFSLDSHDRSNEPMVYLKRQF